MPIEPLRKPLSLEITGDRACAKCGYNLKGLKAGNQCPECGVPIRASAVDPLAGWVITDAPGNYLRDLGFASVLMAMCAIFLSLGIVWTLVESPWTNGVTLWPGGGAAAASVGWILAIWIITTPRPTPDGQRRMEKEWVAVRWIARGTQVLWVIATPLVVWGAYSIGEFNINGTALPPLANAAVATGMFLWLVAFCGLGAVAIYLARLADWATDTTLSERLRLVPYALGMGGFMLAFLVLLRGPIGYQGGGLATLFLGSLAALLLLMAISQFGLALFSFANLARWSVSSRAAKLESQVRRASIVVNRIDQGRAKPMDLEGAVVEGSKPKRPQGKVVQASGHVDPYDLAPPSA